MQATLKDRVCLITGATAGMGKATAAALAEMGATVVLVARNEQKGIAVRDELRATSGNPKVEVLFADLASQQAIRALAAQFKQQYHQLHVLVNNAGGVFSTRETTVDGLEMTFALDHLAYFLLTDVLLDLLKSSAPARIINISSGAERTGKITFDDLQREKSYTPFGAYAQAKLGNMLFTYELARRLAGTGVTVNAVTPGPVATSFGTGGKGILKVIPLFVRLLGKTPEQGASSAIQLAADPTFANVTGKAFYGRKEVSSSARSHDVALQQRLWQHSVALTGVATSAADHA